MVRKLGKRLLLKLKPMPPQKAEHFFFLISRFKHRQAPVFHFPSHPTHAQSWNGAQSLCLDQLLVRVDRPVDDLGRGVLSYEVSVIVVVILLLLLWRRLLLICMDGWLTGRSLDRVRWLVGICTGLGNCTISMARSTRYV